jgi:hypothetical protein
MAKALDTHITLLGRYIDAVRGGDETYLGEIAGKLRLLVIAKGDQKPLLRRLADLTGDDLTVTIGGPEGWTFMEGYKAGDVIPLGDWLSSFAIGVQTSEGPVQLTNAQFVSTWAEQYGAAHEDWSLKEPFHVTLDSGEQMRAMAAYAAHSAPREIAGIFGALAAGPAMHVRKLMEIAITTHRLGTGYLSQLTEDKVNAAENELRRRQGRPSLEEEAAAAAESSPQEPPEAATG